MTGFYMKCNTGLKWVNNVFFLPFNVVLRALFWTLEDCLPTKFAQLKYNTQTIKDPFDKELQMKKVKPSFVNKEKRISTTKILSKLSFWRERENHPRVYAKMHEK